MDGSINSESAVGRTQLIEATLDCLANNGMPNTTVRNIAAKAGVSPGLVRHHFGSKDKLLLEAYQHMNQLWLDRVEASYDSSSDIERNLKQALQAYFPHNKHDIQRMTIIMTYWSMVATNPEIARIQADTYSAFQTLFAGLLAAHTTLRGNANDIASGIIGLADGLWIECCLNPDRLTHDQAFRITWEFALARLNQRN